MKLLVITSSYPPHQIGGYEIRCRDVVEALKKRGHQILILTTQCPEKECGIHIGETLVERKLNQKVGNQSVVHQILLDCKDIKLIDKIVKEYHPDLIYLWAIQNLSNVILPYFSDQKIPIVYDEGGSGLIYLAKIYRRGLYFFTNENDSSIKKIIKRSIYQIADICSKNLINSTWSWPKNMRVYYNSNSSRNFAKEGGVPVANSLVIYSGIDLSRFRFISRDHLENPINIIVPGRIKHQKGIKDCIYLIRALLNKKIVVKLSIIGKIQDEDYYNEIIRMINKTEVCENIEFLPMVSQSELVSLYQVSDICFFPSYFKSGLSRVPLEAMACGSLVVTYGNEGSNEIILDQETGFIVTEGDIKAAATIIENLVNDPVTYGIITTKAREQIEEKNRLDIYVNEVEEFLLDSL